MAFILNPYLADLDLSDKDDRKLFQEGCKDFKKEADFFDGKREDFDDFCKLMEKEFEQTKMMECLYVPTSWPTTGTAEQNRIPEADGMVDIFETHQLEREKVRDYSELVWADTTHGGNTPKYYVNFATAPGSTSALKKVRNQRRLCHVMMGHKVWNSLTSNFQLELIVDKDEFKLGGEFDGPLLWDFIRRRINPTTTVGASKLKGEIETAKLADFDHDVSRFHTWFQSQKKKIKKEEGEGKYNEYLRQLFRIYNTSNNNSFLQAIGEEERRWEQGRLGANYSFRQLLDLGRTTYNNLLDKKAWKTTEKDNSKDKKDEKANASSDDKEVKFLALATEILKNLNNGGQNAGSNNNPTSGSGNGDSKAGKGRFKPWRFENPDNAATKMVNNITFKWCSKDCHPKPMWCARENCLDKADFAKKMEKEKGTSGNSGQSANKTSMSKDFKIALAAMTSADDYKSLMSQFSSEK